MGRRSYRVESARAGQARQNKGLTQAAAAEDLSINRVTLNKIENGHANVSLELLERMARLYACSREWLIGEPEAVDEVEIDRERIANALSSIRDGFEALDAVLAGRLREAADAARGTDRDGVRA